MAPYHNVRYWLTHKEKFNYSHAKLNNVIEHAFGVLKERFPTLKRVARFLLVIKRHINITLFALHNIIRKKGPSDDYFARYDKPNVFFWDNDVPIGNSDEDKVPTHDIAAEHEYVTQLHDKIV